MPFRQLFLSITILSSITVSLFSQDSLRVETIGRSQTFWLGTGPFEVVDDHAYVLTGYALQIIDTSHPDSMFVAGICDIYSEAVDLNVAGEYAYICAGHELYILDISDPTNPFNAAMWQSDNVVISSLIQDTLAYVKTGLGMETYLHSIDISSPEEPIEVGDSLIINSPWIYGGMGVYENYLIIPNQWREVTLVDISDPVEMNIHSTIDLEFSVRSVLSKDSIVFLFDNHSNIYSANFSDIDSIEIVASFEIDNQREYKAHALKDTLAFIADDSTNIMVLDISDPADMFIVDTIVTNSHPKRIEIQDDILYAGLTNWDHDSLAGIQLFDIADYTEPEPLGTYWADRAWLMRMSGGDNLLYASSAVGSGLLVFDIEDPLNPSLIGKSESDGYISPEIIYSEGFVYTLSEQMGGFGMRGFRIYDVQNPDSITMTVDFRGDHHLVKASIKDSELISISDEGYLVIYNIEDNENPEFVSSLQIGEDREWTYGYFYPPAIVEDYALIAVGNLGLVVVDLADSQDPEIVEILEGTRGVQSVKVFEDFVVTEGYSGLSFYELNWGELEHLGNYNPEYSIYDYAVDQDHLYNLTPFDGFRILDITDVENPREVGFYLNDEVFYRRLTTLGDHIVALAEDHITVYDVSEALGTNQILYSHPSSFTLYPAYPNPFNNRTTVSFSLPQPGAVSLGVYDAIGRQISELYVPGQRPAGNYNLSWSAEGIPSGTYLLKLRFGEEIKSQKVILSR